jgi:hypothetical protein
MSAGNQLLMAPTVPRRLLSREFAVRLALCFAGVAVCYSFQWQWLRALTCSLNIVTDRWVGVDLVRVHPNMVLWHGRLYHYAVACTFADAWCGALPLIWDLRSRIDENLRTIAGFTVVLFAFNIARLTFSDVLVAHGTPWALGHSAVGGICYFALWAWIAGRRAPWRQHQTPLTAP